MLAGHYRHVRKRTDAIDCRYVAHLNERVAPIAGFENITHEISEPLTLENLFGFGILFSVFGPQNELLLQGLAVALAHAARQVEIDQGICVAVVELRTFGVFDVDGHLPCRAPGGDILLREVGRHLFELYENAALLLGGLGSACGHEQRLVGPAFESAARNYFLFTHSIGI